MLQRNSGVRTNLSSEARICKLGNRFLRKHIKLTLMASGSAVDSLRAVSLDSESLVG